MSNYLFILTIFFFSLGQLGRIELLGSNIVVHLNDIFVATVGLTWIILRGHRALAVLLSHPLSRPFGAVALVMFISLVFNITTLSPVEILTSLFYLLRWASYSLFFFAIFHLVKVPASLPRLLFLTSLIVSGSGLLQYFIFPNVSFLEVGDWDDHYYRLIGVFLDPGFTGAILALSVGLIYLTLKGPERIIGLVLSYVSLALTYSRASYLMFLVIFFGVSLFRKNLVPFLAAVVLLAATIFVLPKSSGEGTKLGRENSIEARIRNWQESLTVWRTSPILGVGFNTYRYAKARLGILNEEGLRESHSGAGADSSLLFVLATTGIVGALAYLWLLVSLWQYSKGNIVFRTAFLGILIHSFFNNTLFYPAVLEWLWLSLALRGKLHRNF